MFNRKIGLVAIGAVLVAAVAFLLLRPTEPCCADATVNIVPDAYQDQFISGSEPHLLIDVRTVQEFDSGHIAGAVNIPVESLESRLSEVPRDQTIVVYCRSGNRSAQAARILTQAGYTGIYDLGGLNTWTAQGYPVE